MKAAIRAAARASAPEPSVGCRGRWRATASLATGTTVPGSPADSAGLNQGDVITTVGGTTVDPVSALTNLRDRSHPGDKVKLSWIDVSGQSHSTTVTLTTGPVG